MVAADWDSSYVETPPWDIGRPQPVIRELAETAEIAGAVLDIGCGTGENALYLAQRGHDVVGFDWARRAIDKARAKAKDRHLVARFEVRDALSLKSPPRLFDTAIDCGLFHVFSDEERIRYRESLARVIRSGGTYLMMCFSEHQPGTWGPRRVTQSEIRSTFDDGWKINYIRPAEFETTMGAASAWLCSIARS